MVLKQARKRKAVRKYSYIVLITLIICGALACIFTLKNNPTGELDEKNDNNSSVSRAFEKSEVEVAKINFQPIVDEWTRSIGGNKSVIIYDLERNEIVGAYNTDEDYNTASLYKLFVVYEGYRRVQSGEWQADARAGSTGKTILECLDLAVRESYSPCAETLWSMVGYNTLDEIIEDDFDIHNSQISNLLSNTSDIMKIMKIFYNHLEITDEKLITRMKDSFLNQPETTYNWRQGLPSGFEKAKVYNKVGWDYNAEGGYWNIYHDAAIVEFPEDNRHFIVVVMTNLVPYQQITKLGSMLEKAYYQ